MTRLFTPSRLMASTLIVLTVALNITSMSVSIATTPTESKAVTVPVPVVKTTPAAVTKSVSQGVTQPEPAPAAITQQTEQADSMAFSLKANTDKAVKWVDHFAQGYSFLRNLELDVAPFTEAGQLATSAQTPAGLLAYLEQAQPIILHMEAIRQGYQTFGKTDADRNAFMDGLKKRYTADNNNPVKFFDFGYAELVFESNKNGLFFLRKANDKIGSPYTSMAYGIAQVDTDRWIENAPPEQLTTRKMDVQYKLKDALLFNRTQRQPAVWSNYVRIVKALKPFAAFNSLTQEDVTLLYVPMGQLLMARTQGLPVGVDVQALLAQTSNAPPAPDCGISAINFEPKAMVRTKGYDFNKDGMPESINFYTQGSDKPHMVQVTNVYNQVIGQFPSWVNYIIEDLESDGTYELVVRQFDKDINDPLRVYRWNGKCFMEDKTVSSYFQ